MLSFSSNSDLFGDLLLQCISIIFGNSFQVQYKVDIVPLVMVINNVIPKILFE